MFRFTFYSRYIIGLSPSHRLL